MMSEDNPLQRQHPMPGSLPIDPKDPRPAVRILEPIWQPGMTLAELEKRTILQALRVYGGNQTATADALGISVRTIANKLATYGVKGTEK